MKGPITLTLLVAAPKSHPEVTLPIFHLTLPFNHKAPRTACRGRGGRDAGRRAAQPTSEEMEVAESVALPLPTLPPSNGLPPDETSAFFSSFAPSDGTIGATRRRRCTMVRNLCVWPNSQLDGTL